jgi:molecular chaperone Hsp33
MSEEAMQPVEDFTVVESIFVRHRNCLLLRAQFTPIFTGYYIHLMEHKLRYAPDLDATLKDMMAVLTLHLTARPWAETIAWTANLRAPRVNYFVTGGSRAENIVGRLFTEDVRDPDRNFLYSQTLVSGKDPSTTTIHVETGDPIEWVERYYEKSEQRPARCFQLEDENYVLIAAQPGYDEDWFAGLNAEVAANILDAEETKVLETRKFQFLCGCSLERILPTLNAWKGKLDELFQGEQQIKVSCPRCGASYWVTREML